MNKTAIKNYAIWARVQLIESCKQRAFEYGVTEDGNYASNLKTIGSRILTDQELEQRNQLIARISQKGYAQVMEEAAYTWFNRFIAMRFMEVNGYLPSKVRVFTDETGAFKPEIIKEAMTVDLEGIDRAVVIDLLEKQDNEALYKYLLIAQCNALSIGLPYMFEKISNWTELLFPANLLRNDSVLERMIADIPEEDWDNEVEIIGWCYQYYISEKHEEVIDPLHGKVIKKEDIPAATQLFTTDWVVRYILDNSLGRYWIERQPESKLTEKLNYLITPIDGVVPVVHESIIPEELKVLDPCVGSGHFLTYAFDILLEIYRECGWSDRDAAKSIVENNLYGLDIDDRAAQLACFAVMMKARKYNRRIISADTKPHILAMQDSTSISNELIKYVSKQDSSVRNDLNVIQTLFNNAKEYGSIITVPNLDFSSLYAHVHEVKNAYADNVMEIAFQRETEELLLPLIQQAEILAGSYDIVATNPPYMNKYSSRLKAYIGEHYEAYKGDLFSVFIYRNFGFCKPNGYTGFMTPNVWLFNTKYEKLRKEIISCHAFSTLVQMAKGAFYREATVDVCAFTLANNNKSQEGTYFRLEEFKGDMARQEEAFLLGLSEEKCTYRFDISDKMFSVIDGSPIAYWANDQVLRAFKNLPRLSKMADLKHGMSTSDNDKYLRLWYEVSLSRINFAANGKEDTFCHRWFPILKGGEFRKWYGNFYYVVNWEKDGEEIKYISNIKYPYLKGNLDFVLGGQKYFFLEGITWSSISSGSAGFRYYPKGFMFTNKGQTLFMHELANQSYILGFLNSKVVKALLEMLAPTIGFELGYISKLPVALGQNRDTVSKLTEENVELSIADWDSFETSWEFKKHPLI